MIAPVQNASEQPATSFVPAGASEPASGMDAAFRNARTTSHNDAVPIVISDSLIQNTGW